MTLARSIFLICTISVVLTLARLKIDKDQLRLYPNCGRFKKETIKDSAKLTNINRIANANDLEYVIPWSMYIASEYRPKSGPMVKRFCSGNLITATAVLTAASCVCNIRPVPSHQLTNQIPCLGPFNNNQMRKTLKIIAHHKPKQLNQLIPANAYTVESAFIYSTDANHISDIGVLILNRKVNNVVPICLPLARRVSDFKKKIAYLAAYGLRYHAKAGETMCQTNSVGPAKYETCEIKAFPYCEKNKPPPGHESFCTDIFLKALNAAKKRAKELLRKVVINKAGQEIICYGTMDAANSASFGWCNTNTNTSSWGFCSKECSFNANSKDNNRKQAIAQLRIGQDSVCQGLLGRLRYDKKLYMCAYSGAVKWRFAKVDVDANNEVTSEFIFEKEPIEDMHEITNTVSCSGDAGGNLFKYIKKKGHRRATSLAVLSYGYSICGQHDPTKRDYIALVVKDALEWIKEKAGIK